MDLDRIQLDAIDKLENGNILRGGVGSGKSRTALAYFAMKVCDGGIPINGDGSYEKYRTPKDIYIITTAKKRDSRDWVMEGRHFLIGDEEPSNNLCGIRYTVDSWNNITKYVDVEDAFFIFDEQRVVGSGSWSKAMIKIAAKNEWILLSATPGDNWMDYISVFVANGFYKNRTQFTRRHVRYNNYAKFPKVEGYREEGYLYNLKKQITVNMPYRARTTRHVKHIMTDYDRAKFETIFKDRWDPWKNEPVKNVSGLFYLMRMCVNEDDSRLDELTKIIDRHKRVIVFYNFTYELILLEGFCRMMGIHYAQWNGVRHEEVPEGHSEWVYLVQYTAGAEAWECITTNATVFYSLNYSYKINEQAKGRTDRRNTPFLDQYYYIFYTDSYIDRAILKALEKKENFNEKGFEF